MGKLSEQDAHLDSVIIVAAAGTLCSCILFLLVSRPTPSRASPARPVPSRPVPSPLSARTQISKMVVSTRPPCGTSPHLLRRVEDNAVPGTGDEEKEDIRTERSSHREQASRAEFATREERRTRTRKARKIHTLQ